jgi:hypothetical protein
MVTWHQWRSLNLLTATATPKAQAIKPAFQWLKLPANKNYATFSVVYKALAIFGGGFFVFEYFQNDNGGACMNGHVCAYPVS